MQKLTEAQKGILKSIIGGLILKSDTWSKRTYWFADSLQRCNNNTCNGLVNADILIRSDSDVSTEFVYSINPAAIEYVKKQLNIF